jgi:hypothetical protein
MADTDGRDLAGDFYDSDLVFSVKGKEVLRYYERTAEALRDNRGQTAEKDVHYGAQFAIADQ